MIHSKQHRGSRIQDPGTRGKHQTKTTNPWCTSRGCRVQNSGPWDPWLPVVENSRLFAQRTVRPLIHARRCNSAVPVVRKTTSDQCVGMLTQPNRDARARNTTAGLRNGPTRSGCWSGADSHQPDCC